MLRKRKRPNWPYPELCSTRRACTTCGAYAKYDGGLCLDCYTKKKKNCGKDATAPLEKKTEKPSGLTDKERSFRYGMIKGRIAETLI